jgi:3',5'-cyclic AMP phosphodiesterase CpdA
VILTSKSPGSGECRFRQQHGYVGEIAVDTLTIHHLSDIHIGSHHRNAPNQGPIGQANPGKGPRKINVDRYLTHLERLDSAARPDLVVISGDLTSTATEEEMRAAGKSIENIVYLLKAKNRNWSGADEMPYLLVVPGNHDLDWSKDDYDDRLIRYKEHIERLSESGAVLSAPVAQRMDPNSVAGYDFGDECNIYIYLLSTIRYGGIKLRYLETLHKDLEQVYNNKSNLAELERLARKDPGYVPDDYLEHMRTTVRNVPATRLKVAVMHHNLTSVPSEEIDEFNTILNSGRLKTGLREQGFDLVLHGHRHLAYGNRQRLLDAEEQPFQDLLVIGAGTLGCSDDGRFVKIEIHNPSSAHGREPRAAVVTATEWCVPTFTQQYSAVKSPFIREPIHRPLHEALHAITTNIGRPKVTIDDQNRLEGHLRFVMPSLERLKHDVYDWAEKNEGEVAWDEKFHSRLGEYTFIYATDMQERSSAESPRFGQYIRDQFSARLKALHEAPNKILRFSPDVFDAIINTGWRPDPALWSDYSRAKTDWSDFSGLEIVRVLLRQSRPQSEPEKQTLRNLDFDHRVVAAPLFVADAHELKAPDFVIGLNEAREAHPVVPG